MRTTFVLALLFAAACGRSGEHEKAEPAQSAAPAAPTASHEAVAPVPSATAQTTEGKPVELQVTAHAAAMAFEPTELTVPAGSTVHLVLQNEKPGALPHNWALVAPGSEAKVAADGLTKGEEASYIAEGPNLLAYTKLVPPGASGEVTFKAPAAGKYPYICTYPGHYVMMKGVLTVTP